MSKIKVTTQQELDALIASGEYKTYYLYGTPHPQENHIRWLFKKYGSLSFQTEGTERTHVVPTRKVHTVCERSKRMQLFTITSQRDLDNMIALGFHRYYTLHGTPSPSEEQIRWYFNKHGKITFQIQGRSDKTNEGIEMVGAALERMKRMPYEQSEIGFALDQYADALHIV